MLLIDPLRGTTAAVAAVVVCLCCRRMAIKTFGGITGDIQGFFLQICELAMAYVVIFAIKGGMFDMILVIGGAYQGKEKFAESLGAGEEKPEEKEP